MYPGNFFIPRNNFMNGFISGIGPSMNMVRGNPFFRGNILGRTGLLNRITTGLKSFNWKSLINGANKTLNVVNQTIPLIREAKPMVSNVKSMVQLAKAFGHESGNNKRNNNISRNQHNLKNSNPNNHVDCVSEVNNNPTFFI